MRPRRVLLMGALLVSVAACSESPAPSPAAHATSATSGATATTSAPATTASASATTASASATTATSTAPEPSPTPEGMVRIPGALFMMGATAFRGNPEERPMHEAAVASFFLDEDEVTLAEYHECVEQGACKATYRDH
ncbi:MAG TPA: hypothetical protein ENK57_17760, partial [Polyangiaceae bacterium]|nr:hypothetical protein [Polyangiaceae bacterium]